MLICHLSSSAAFVQQLPMREICFIPGDGSDVLTLAAPGSVIAMEATVAGMPPDALAAADDTGPIEPLDAKALKVIGRATCIIMAQHPCKCLEQHLNLLLMYVQNIASDCI